MIWNLSPYHIKNRLIKLYNFDKLKGSKKTSTQHIVEYR